MVAPRGPSPRRRQRPPASRSPQLSSRNIAALANRLGPIQSMAEAAGRPRANCPARPAHRLPRWRRCTLLASPSALARVCRWMPGVAHSGIVERAGARHPPAGLVAQPHLPPTVKKQRDRHAAADGAADVLHHHARLPRRSGWSGWRPRASNIRAGQSTQIGVGVAKTMARPCATRICAWPGHLDAAPSTFLAFGCSSNAPSPHRRPAPARQGGIMAAMAAQIGTAVRLRPPPDDSPGGVIGKLRGRRNTSPARPAGKGLRALVAFDFDNADFMLATALVVTRGCCLLSTGGE